MVSSGQYYGLAAATGKLGAFTGTYVFKAIQDRAGPKKVPQFKVKRGQYPVYVSSGFAILCALLALFCLPEITQDSIQDEDVKFKAFLEQHGYDTGAMGLAVENDRGEVVDVKNA